MKSVTDNQTLNTLTLGLVLGITSAKEMDPVCAIIDPYLTAFCELNPGPLIGCYETENALKGIHFAFWIMSDELHKLPTDVDKFSQLMQRCLDVMLISPEEKTVLIQTLIPNPTAEQLLWMFEIMRFRLVNHSSTYSCVWTLIQLWDHIRLQEEFCQSLRAERSTS